MKKLSLKSKILLGAILLGGTAAGAQVISKLPSAEEQRYDWNGEGPNHSGMLPNSTIEEAVDAFGCQEDAPTLCATGVADGVPPAQIFKD